jgi:phage replication O-like protein O
VSEAAAKIPAQNYTQIPNILLDYMRLLSESEFKVIMSVCRETFGWQTRSAKLSIALLTESTGLGHSSVEGAIKKLLERGLVGREPEGKGFLYRLIVDVPKIQGGPQNSGRSTSPESGEVCPQNLGSPIKGKKRKESSSLGQAEASQLPSSEEGGKKKGTAKLTDDEFIKQLATSPAYEGIDVRREVEKAKVWLLTKPGRKLTRSFVVNWLNKVEKPMKTGGASLIHPAHRPHVPRIPGMGNF